MKSFYILIIRQLNSKGIPVFIITCLSFARYLSINMSVHHAMSEKKPRITKPRKSLAYFIMCYIPCKSDNGQCLVGHTNSRQITEVKQRGPRLVLGWETIWGKTRCCWSMPAMPIWWTHASHVYLVKKPFWEFGKSCKSCYWAEVVRVPVGSLISPDTSHGSGP